MAEVPGPLPTRTRDPRAAGLRSRRQVLGGVLIALGYSTGLALARFIDVSDDGKAMLLFGTTFTLVAMVSVLVAPRWFVPLLATYLPFSRAYPLPVAGITGANLTNFLLILGLLAWLADRTKPRPRVRLGPPELLAAAYVAFGTLSVFTASAGGTSAVTLALAYRAWLAPALIFFIVRGLVRDRTDVTAALVVMGWTSTLVGALTWLEGLDRSSRSSIDASRVAGLMMQPNSMGAFLVYYGVPLLAFAVCARPFLPRALPFLAGYLVVARAILFTFSRGAYLGLAAGSAVVLLLRRPLLLVLAGGAVFLAVLVNPELVPESVRNRLSTTQEGQIYEGEGGGTALDTSSANRLTIWKGGLRMILDRPLLGVGLGRFGLTIDFYTDYPLDPRHPRDAHNAFLLVAAEMGLPALLLLLLFLAALSTSAALSYFRRRTLPDHPLGLACLGTVMGMVVTCMLGSRFSDESLIGYFWMLAALTVVVGRLPVSRGTKPRPAWR